MIVPSSDFTDEVPQEKPVIRISGLAYPVKIYDEHMRIGCLILPFSEWKKAKDIWLRLRSPDKDLAEWHKFKAAIFALMDARKK